MTGDDWPQLLREQGRSMTWLALRVGVSRQYLSAVASGARQPSPALVAAIRRQLRGHDERLEQADRYAAWRAAFLDIRDVVAGTLVEQPELADRLLTAAGWLLVAAAALYFGGHIVAALAR